MSKKEEEQSAAFEREPLQYWFLRLWIPAVIAVIAAFMTIVFGFRQDWELAIAVVVTGCALSTASLIVRFYHRHFYIRDKEREKQLLLRDKERENKVKGMLEAREASGREKDTKINQLKTEINRQKNIVSYVRAQNLKAIEAVWQFIQVCRYDNEKMLTTYKNIENNTEQLKDAIITIGLAQNFLHGALNRMIHIFQALLPTVKLWAAVRQHKPRESVYVTQVRCGSFNPVREDSSEPIIESRSIPKMLRNQYNKDGIGVIITHPKAPEYDKVENDKYKENFSIIAAPILSHKTRIEGQIIIEMPMWIAINSPQPNVFPDIIKPYMACCVSILSELVKTWPDLIKVVK